MVDDTAGEQPHGGQRKDGKPFKEGNLREDGSYETGKGRPPVHTRFGQAGAPPPGKRKKGGKNSGTIWRKKLSQKITIEGKTQTALEWLIEGTIRRGIARSDRAAETAIGKAGDLEIERERNLGKSDNEIIDAWLEQRLADAGAEILDDADSEAAPGDEESNEEGGEEANDADI